MDVVQSECGLKLQREREIHFQEYQQPEILDADLASLALELALWGTAPSAVKDMKWCDVPPENKLLQAWNLLKSLDCIDDAGHLKAYGKKL